MILFAQVGLDNVAHYAHIGGAIFWIFIGILLEQKQTNKRSTKHEYLGRHKMAIYLWLTLIRLILINIAVFIIANLVTLPFALFSASTCLIWFAIFAICLAS